MPIYSDSESESYDSDSSYEDEVESRLSMLESKTHSLENKMNSFNKTPTIGLHSLFGIFLGYVCIKYYFDIYSLFE